MAATAEESFRCYLKRATQINNGGWHLEPAFARALLQPIGQVLPSPEDRTITEQQNVSSLIGSQTCFCNQQDTVISALPWLLRTPSCHSNEQCGDKCTTSCDSNTSVDEGQEATDKCIVQNKQVVEPIFIALLRRIDQWLSFDCDEFTPWPMPSPGAILEGLLISQNWLVSKRYSAQVLVNAIAHNPHAAMVLVDSLFRVLGHRGVQQLLGLRTTTGTVTNALPPNALVLLKAFEVEQAPSNSKSAAALTVGARAWTKHCHRGADGWWGVSRGDNANKNALARSKLLEILTNAVWTNVIFVPADKQRHKNKISTPSTAEHTQIQNTLSSSEQPENQRTTASTLVEPTKGEGGGGSTLIVALEIRTALGYGARWTLRWPPPQPLSQLIIKTGLEDKAKIEGLVHTFRGFLEPVLFEDGHTRGWRH